MKQKTILVFISAMLLLAASDPRNPLKGKLKTFYSSQNRDTMTFYYDDAGRLSYYTGAREYKTSYEYKGNTIIETTEGGSRVTMYLNKRSLVDSLIDIDPMKAFENGKSKMGMHPTREFPYSGRHVLGYLDGGVASRNTPLITKKFEYDTAGFLIRETEYVNGQLRATSNNVYENDNLTSYTIKYFLDDTIKMIDQKTRKEETRIIQLTGRFFTISYDKDKRNSFAIDGSFGRCSKNLPVRIVDHSLPLSADSTVYTLHYTFDHNQRVSGLIKRATSNDPPEWNNDSVLGGSCSFTYY